MKLLRKTKENGNMKIIKNFITAVILTAFGFIGCQGEKLEGLNSLDNYYASVETFGTDTKTSLGEENSVVWSTGDQIAIFAEGSNGQAYEVLDSYVGKSSGEFSMLEGLTTKDNAAVDGTIAVYPFNENLNITSAEDSYKITGITFPAEQRHTAGSFSDESFPMAAFAPEGSRNLSFKNIGGILKLSLIGNYSVSKITLTGNSGEPLSGSATIILGPDGIPSIQMSDNASTSVTLICSPAVQLDPETASDFYISIPPTDFESGFKVTILDKDGKEHGLATHKHNSAERSSILAMPESTTESLDDIELTVDTFCSVDFIEGWTETRFGGDGTIIFIKKDGEGRMTHTLMFLPDEKNILMPVYIRYDENEIPSYMSFMDTEIYIDGYTENTIDFTLAVEEAVWSIKDVSCNELIPYSLHTKAWADNNAIRNACAIGNLIVGISGVAGGVVMISASGIAAAITGGASTPISVAGIALGIMSIKGGCDSIVSCFETIFGPAEQTQSTYVKDGLMNIGIEKLSDAIQDAPKNEFIKSKLPASILKDPADLGKHGTISYWSGFLFSSIDEVWGKTYTGPADLAQVHQEVNVLTGRADNITTDSAELYGYVSPEATAPFGEKIITEIYIVVWKSSDTSSRMHQSVYFSDGGIISFTFTGLEPDTEYCYKTVFEDVDNKLCRFGEVNTFKTSGDRWVDLGLSVLWAAYNVGANSPEEYGGYYAWGETSTKSGYSLGNYNFNYSAFMYSGISGTKYDVANVTWGEGARMPTSSELSELMSMCTWTYGTYNGRSGNYVTGPNGNSIFLPYAGAKGTRSFDTAGVYGNYWSGTYDSGDSGPDAYYILCSRESLVEHHSWKCYHGRSVRPVKNISTR